ncbi:MAG TPA: NAD(P)H-dependent oxidoreductase [Rhizomicrobium sp.]
MKLLHIDASILGANSASRQLSAAVVAQLRKVTPALDVTYRDLAAQPLAHLSDAHVAAAMGAVPAGAEAEIAASQAVLDEFLAADTVVIGAPMYNFGVASQLKAWIDRIAVRGKTFAYDANGPRGLVGDKRVIITVSRGGVYGADAPAAAFEHMETYLRSVFGFLGVTDPQIIVAEGLNMGPEQREKAIQDALTVAAKLAA